MDQSIKLEMKKETYMLLRKQNYMKQKKELKILV